MLWLLLALAEIVAASILARPGMIGILRLLIFVRPKHLLGSDSTYFMHMLADDLIRIVPAAILVAHAVWIARTRIRTSTVG